MPASCAAILPSAVKTAKAWLRIGLVVHQTGLFDGDTTKANWDSNLDIIKIWFKYVKYVWESLGTRGFEHFGTSTKQDLEIGPFPRVDQPIKCGNALQCPSSNWKYSFGRTDKFNLVFLEPSWTPGTPKQKIEETETKSEMAGKKEPDFQRPRV